MENGSKKVMTAYYGIVTKAKVLAKDARDEVCMCVPSLATGSKRMET